MDKSAQTGCPLGIELLVDTSKQELLLVYSLGYDQTLMVYIYCILQ